MSVRHSAKNGPPPHVAQIQKELHDLKATALAATQSDSVTPASVEAPADVPKFESLSGVEQSAASLGVHPDAWRPIGFLNNAHYESLRKNNALDDDLARRIDACTCAIIKLSLV